MLDDAAERHEELVRQLALADELIELSGQDLGRKAPSAAHRLRRRLSQLPPPVRSAFGCPGHHWPAGTLALT
jgi:hypothetical protein